MLGEIGPQSNNQSNKTAANQSGPVESLIANTKHAVNDAMQSVLNGSSTENTDNAAPVPTEDDTSAAIVELPNIPPVDNPKPVPLVKNGTEKKIFRQENVSDTPAPSIDQVLTERKPAKAVNITRTDSRGTDSTGYQDSSSIDDIIALSRKNTETHRRINAVIYGE